VRGGAIRIVGYVAGALVGVLSAALLFRHLGVHDTGQYVLALSLVTILATFSDLGLTAVGIREMSQLVPRERAAIASDLLGLRITLTIAGGIVIVAIARVAYSATLAAGVALACVGLLLQATQDNYAMPLVVGLRLGTVSLLDFGRQLLTTLSIVALVLAGATLVPFLAVSIPVGAVLLLATALLVRGTRTLLPRLSWTRWRELVGAMLPYSAAVAASALYFRVSILLVSALSSGTQAGYFSASFRIVEVLTVVPALLVGSALPIFARAAREDHRRLGYALGRVFEVALIVGAWVAVSIAVGAPLAIAIVGGPKFAPAAPVLAIQGLALGAMFVSIVWGNALLSLGVYRTILTLSVSALLLNAAVVTALTLLDGARGAALGTAMAEIALGAVQYLAAVRRRPSLRPSARVVPRVALAAGLALTPLAIAGLPTVVRLLISSALFAAVLAGTRAFPPELADLLRRRDASAGGAGSAARP
jgi:O-antigen/teichoic acid export membrane protein